MFGAEVCPKLRTLALPSLRHRACVRVALASGEMPKASRPAGLGIVFSINCVRAEGGTEGHQVDVNNGAQTRLRRALACEAVRHSMDATPRASQAILGPEPAVTLAREPRATPRPEAEELSRYSHPGGRAAERAVFCAPHALPLRTRRTPP